MLNLSTSAISWLEMGDTRTPCQNRGGKTYRAIEIHISPEERTLVLRFSPVKEVGILAQGYMPIYAGDTVAGMFEAQIQGGTGSLKALSSGFDIGPEDLQNSMMAYYEVGEPSEKPDQQRIGVPVQVVAAITGKRQVRLIPKTRTVQASPDLNGKTVKIRCEFPYPSKGTRFPSDRLTPAILCGETITRYHSPILQPWDDRHKTTFVFKNWRSERVDSLRRA